ncbi:MAG: SUMF1/EgtB/PvdO family nonheme iron enzyme, partial [Spirochaetota bacterium]
MNDEHEGCCTPGRSAHASDHGPVSSASTRLANGTPTKGLDAPARAGVRHHGDLLVPLDGGAFLMGTDDEEGFPQDGEGPVREVTVSPFAIDRHSVTNEQFAEFVEATGYVTEAERFGWSFVFALFVPKRLLHRGIARKVPGLDWWYGVTNARWDRPEGPGSNLDGRMDHP